MCGWERRFFFVRAAADKMAGCGVCAGVRDKAGSDTEAGGRATSATSPDPGGIQSRPPSRSSTTNTRGSATGLTQVAVRLTNSRAERTSMPGFCKVSSTVALLPWATGVGQATFRVELREPLMVREPLTLLRVGHQGVLRQR